MRDFWRRYRKNRAAVGGLVVVALIVLLAVLGPRLYEVDPFDMAGRPHLPPGGDFPLGTDVSGRDILAGIIHGAPVSLAIGVIASLVATLVGVAFGAIAGYYGGLIDDALMRTTEFFLTIPSFILAVVIVAIFAPSVYSITAAIALVSWPSVARLVRGEFIAQREREYVQACRALGMRDWEIILVQILPNTLAPVIVISTLMVATAILTESGLSFLGLGDPNYMSWGYMIGVARTALRIAWWMTAIPGLMIVIAVIAINLAGEGLNDALNPKLRER